MKWAGYPISPSPPPLYVPMSLTPASLCRIPPLFSISPHPYVPASLRRRRLNPLFLLYFLHPYVPASLRRRRLNPLFIRSQIRTNLKFARVKNFPTVSIPYSSGLRFERIVVHLKNGACFKSQSLIHQVSDSNEMNLLMKEREVLCLNPLFIRSQIRTAPRFFDRNTGT